MDDIIMLSLIALVIISGTIGLIIELYSNRNSRKNSTQTQHNLKTIRICLFLIMFISLFIILYFLYNG